MSGGQLRAALVLLGAATLLMVAGLAVELGLTRPRLEEIRRQEARQLELQRAASAELARRQEVRDMAEVLHVEDLAQLRDLGGVDPVVYVGRVIQQSNLRRRELSLQGIQQDASLRRSRFVIMVEGDYARMLNFVRTLEQSARPVTVDALDIKVPVGESTLEGKFEVSVYDPVREEASP